MNRQDALKQLADNPNATFGGLLAGKIIAAISPQPCDTQQLAAIVRERYGDAISVSQIQRMAKRMPKDMESAR